MKEGKYAKIVAKVKPVQFFVRERFGEMIFPNKSLFEPTMYMAVLSTAM